MCIKIQSIFLFFLLIFSQASLAMESNSKEIFQIKVHIKDKNYLLACQESKVITDQTEFFIVSDEKNKDLDVTKIIKSDLNHENYYCELGSMKAGLMQLKDNYFLLLKHQGEVFHGVADTIFSDIQLKSFVPKVDELSCGANVETKSNANETDVEVDEESKIDQQVFPQVADRVDEPRYDVYYDGIIDQHYFAEHTDPELPNNERFRVAIKGLQRKILVTNVIAGGEIYTTFKLKKLYAYFGGNKFNSQISDIVSPAQDLWDDIDDFFDGRPRSTRAFATLYSGIERNEADGGTQPRVYPICDNGMMWIRLAPDRFPEVDDLINHDDLQYENAASQLIQNANRFIHEFLHLLKISHNVSYDPARDCCEIAHNNRIPAPEDIGNGIIFPLLLDGDLALRSCMNRNFGYKNDWNEVDQNTLLKAVYTKAMMSSAQSDRGEENFCIGEFKPVISDSNIDDALTALWFNSRMRIEGGNQMCANLVRNILPEIDGIEYESRPRIGGGLIYIFDIHANDPDRGLFEIRGDNGLVENLDGILMYEVTRKWPYPSIEHHVESEVSEFEMPLTRGLNILDVRAYDYSGSYVSQKLLVSGIEPITIQSLGAPEGSGVDDPIFLNFSLNRNFLYEEGGQLRFPSLENRVMVEVDFYGDGSETERFFFDDLEDFFSRPISMNYPFQRDGEIDLKARLVLDGFDFISSHSLVVEENTPPEIYDVSFRPISNLYGNKVSPGYPMEVVFSFRDNENLQSANIHIEWGDGEVSDQQNQPNDLGDQQISIRHTYRTPGNYQLNLVVTDSRGAADRESVRVPVRVPVRITNYNPPQEIIPQQRNRFFARATSMYSAAILEFTFNFGDGNTKVKRVNVESAENGVEMFHQYAGYRAGTPIITSVTVSAVSFPANSAVETRVHRIENYTPEITYGRFHLSLSEDEINQGGDPQNGFSRARGNEVVTFFIRYDDLNLPGDKLIAHWSFSDGGRTFDSLYETGGMRISHEFARISPQEWGEVRVCDLAGACATRRIFLTEENRRELLEDPNELNPENLQPLGPDFGNPFGF